MYIISAEIITKDGESHVFTRDLISVTGSENSKDSELTPQPGIIEQSASLKIYDRDSYFKNNILKSTVEFFRGATVNLYITKSTYVEAICSEDTIVSEDLICGSSYDAENIQIGSYIVDKVEMEGDEDEVSITCVDITRTLSSIKINQYPLANRTLHDFLNIVFGEFLDDATWGYKTSEIETRCRNMHIDNSFITNVDARQFLEQVCLCGMLNIYQYNGIYYVVDSLQGNDNISEYLKLTPSYYSKNLKWDLNIKNQIDTITFTVHDRSIDPTNVLNQNVTQFKHGKYGINTFELANAKTFVQGGTERFYEDETWAMFGKCRTSYYKSGPFGSSKGYVGVYMGFAEFDITVPEPLISIAGEVHYKGVTKYASSFGWDAITNPDQGGAHISDIINIVDNNSPSASSEWVDQSNYVEYTNVAGVNVNPYIKNLHKAGSNEQTTLASDTITKWTGSNHTSGHWWSSSEYKYWVGEYWDDTRAKYGLSPGKSEMWPAMFYDAVFPYSGLTHGEQKIKGLRSGRKKSTLEITKIDDYHYHVVMLVPTMYCYFAYTQENYATLYVVVPVENGWFKFDALAFYDVISEITLNVSGYKYTELKNEYSYSLNSEGGLTDTDLKNNSIFKVNDSQLITENTYYQNNSHPWKHYISGLLLANYSRGRYVVNVDVSAKWCLDNNIHVNSVMIIKLPDNTYIRKLSNDVVITQYSIEYGPLSLSEELSYAPLIMRAPVYSADVGLTYIDFGENDNQTINVYSKDPVTQLLVQETFHNAIRRLTFNRDGSITLYTLSDRGEYVVVHTYADADLTGSGSGQLNGGGLAYFVDKSVGSVPEIMGSSDVINKAIPDKARRGVAKVSAQENPVIFQVKNIMKKFENNKYTYQLSLCEAKIAEVRTQLIETTIKSIVENREYVFNHSISITTSIARFDMRANNIHVRLRYNNNLHVYRDYYVGRIVINKNKNELVTYTWVTGSTFRAYERFDLAALVAQSFYITMELMQSYGSQYNITQFYDNLIGYIEEE